MSNYSCGCLRNDLQPAAIRNRILSLELGDGQSTVIAKDYDDRLLISIQSDGQKKMLIIAGAGCSDWKSV